MPSDARRDAIWNNIDHVYIGVHLWTAGVAICCPDLLVFVVLYIMVLLSLLCILLYHYRIIMFPFCLVGHTTCGCTMHNPNSKYKIQKKVSVRLPRCFCIMMFPLCLVGHAVVPCIIKIGQYDSMNSGKKSYC